MITSIILCYFLYAEVAVVAVAVLAALSCKTSFIISSVLLNFVISLPPSQLINAFDTVCCYCCCCCAAADIIVH